MEESVTVKTPCSAIDILPTVSNLFGLEFDSRLMSGHDVFAENYNAAQASTCMPLVILPTNRGYSWITAAGTYDAKTRTFTPNYGITVADDYVDTVCPFVYILLLCFQTLFCGVHQLQFLLRGARKPLDIFQRLLGLKLCELLVCLL